MNVLFRTYPACKTDFGYQIAFALGGTAVPLPTRRVEVANLKELLAEFDAFKAEAEATGLPLHVSFMQHPSDKSRKFPGFNKAGDERVFTAKAATATEAEVHELSRRA